MAIEQYADQDFLGTNRPIGLPPSVANGQAVEHSQLQTEISDRTAADNVLAIGIALKPDLDPSPLNPADDTAAASSKAVADYVAANATIAIQQDAIANTPARTTLDFAQSTEIQPTVTDNVPGLKKIITLALRAASVALSRIANQAARSVVVNATNAVGPVAALASTVADRVLYDTGAALQWSQIQTNAIADGAVTAAKNAAIAAFSTLANLTAGAASPVAVAVYNLVNRGLLSYDPIATRLWAPMHVFSQYETRTITGTSETSIFVALPTKFTGTRTLPAAMLSQGSDVVIEFEGTFTTAIVPGTIRVRAKVGAVTVGDSGALALAGAGFTGRRFAGYVRLSALLTSGANSTLCGGDIRYFITEISESVIEVENGALSNVDWNVSQVLDVTVEFSVGTNSMAVQNIKIRKEL